MRRSRENLTQVDHIINDKIITCDRVIYFTRPRGLHLCIIGRTHCFMFRCFIIIRARAPQTIMKSTAGRRMIDNNLCFSNHTLVVFENVVKRYTYTVNGLLHAMLAGGRNEAVVRRFIFFDGRYSVFYQLIKYCVYKNYYQR